MSDENVQVRFGANTSDLDDGADHVKDSLNGINSSVSSLSERFTELGKNIAEAFTVDKIIEFVDSTAEAAEQIKRLSDVSGISADTIQTLQYAMKLTGADAETAGALLQHFNRSVYDAASGAGPAFEAFQKLGVSLDDLQHKDADSLFRETLEGMKNIKDSSEFAAIGQQLMSRAFLNIAETAKQGASGLDEFGKKLTETGGRIDADGIDKLSKLKENITETTTAWGAMGKNITEILTPSLDGLLSYFDKTANSLNMVLSVIEGVQQEIAKSEDGAATKNPAPAASGSGGAPQNNINRNKEGQQATLQANADAAKKAQDQEIADATANDQKQRELYAEGYDVKRETDEAKVASGQMTNAEMFADLQAELAKEKAATDQSFTDEMSLYQQGTKQYQALLDERALADQKYDIQKMKLDKQASDEGAKSWQGAFSTIESSFQKMIDGVLQGTQSMGQAFERLAGNLVLTMINATTKMAVDWVEKEARNVMATVAGNQAKLASTEEAQQQGAVAQASSSSESITKDAETAAAGTYASVAAIPLVGWILAPLAAAGAFAAVEAFESFDVGTPNVPRDMLANIHQGEAIIPAKTAQAWRDGDLGVNGGGDTHLHVHAMDSRDVKRFFNQHGDTIAKALNRSYRNGNRSLNAGR